MLVFEKNISEYNPACASLKDFIENLTFGKYLRNLRRADGLTKEELAKKIGCKKQLISDIENGRVEVHQDFAYKIATGMGYSFAPFYKILMNERVRNGSSRSVRSGTNRTTTKENL